MPLGNTNKVEAGDHIAVIGNPLGLEGSLSEGIVAAKREQVPGGHQRLQITAPISRGSSGSPVLDMSGNVVGVATMVMRGGQSLNFAAPVEVAEMMIRTERKALVMTVLEIRPFRNAWQVYESPWRSAGVLNEKNMQLPTLRSARRFALARFAFSMRLAI